jgi:hypothetical protein
MLEYLECMMRRLEAICWGLQQNLWVVMMERRKYYTRDAAKYLDVDFRTLLTSWLAGRADPSGKTRKKDSLNNGGVLVCGGFGRWKPVVLICHACLIL